jgi:CheY-like chemotaxis protein
VDVVLMDLSVPDMDAFAAARLIRTLVICGVPIIAMARDHHEIASQGGGAVDFAGTIVRPYSPRDVHGALQSALSLRPPIAPPAMAALAALADPAIPQPA